MTKDYYSIEEVANILRVSKKTIWQWIKDGRVKTRRVGRSNTFPHAIVMELLGQTIKPQERINIEKIINKALKEYGETFKKLGNE